MKYVCHLTSFYFYIINIYLVWLDSWPVRRSRAREIERKGMNKKAHTVVCTSASWLKYELNHYVHMRRVHTQAAVTHDMCPHTSHSHYFCLSSIRAIVFEMSQSVSCLLSRFGVAFFFITVIIWIIQRPMNIMSKLTRRQKFYIFLLPNEREMKRKKEEWINK